MTHAPESKLLLDRIAVRLRLTAIARAALLAFWIVGGVYAAAFVSSRFLGLITDYFEPITLLVIPGVSLICGVLFHGRPETADAARKVDDHENTRDLYLTVTMLDSTAGEYQPLVQRDAEQKAQNVNPSRVVPFRCNNRAFSWATALILVLFLGLQFGPQLDPFGQVEAATQEKQLQEELKKEKKKTEARVAELAKKQKDDEGEVSKEVKQSLDKLVRALQEMKKEQKKQNQKTLGKEQKRIGAQWRNVRNTDPMKELLNRTAAAQNFGKNLQQMKAEASKILGFEPYFDWEAPRAREGYYRVAPSTEYATERAKAFAPHSDLLWMETATPDVEQARDFARNVRADFPDQMLAYNLSPSFNWDAPGIFNNDEDLLG